MSKKLTRRRCEMCAAFGRPPSEDAIWAYQPNGPDEHPTYTTLGSHYRGFTMLAVCDNCKDQLQAAEEKDDDLSTMPTTDQPLLARLL